MSDTATLPRVESPWATYDEVRRSEFFDRMNQDRRECVQLLRSDGYRLDDDEGHQDAYNCATTWRYKAPGGAFKVSLAFGERNLTAAIYRHDGSLLGATTAATVDWLDEVLP